MTSTLSGSLNQSTIGALRARLEAGGAVTDFDLFFGKYSMGYFLEKAGFGAIPGPTYPIAGLKASITHIMLFIIQRPTLNPCIITCSSKGVWI